MKTYLIPGLLLLGTLGFAVLYVVGPVKKAPQTIAVSKKLGKGASYLKVQQYRQEAAVRADILKQQALMRKKVERPELDPEYKKKNRFHETQLSSKTGPAYYDLRNDSDYEPATLDQRMDEFLATKQQYEELEKAQRELYVQTFIKRALDMGYDVKVNDQMEVVSVKKVGE